MKKKKLLHIVVTVVWIAMLVLLAIFQMPYQVNRIQIQYESAAALDASQMTLRYESDGQFGYAGGDGFLAGGGVVPQCYTDTSTIANDGGYADFLLSVNLNDVRPDQIRLDNCGGPYDITISAIRFYQGDKMLYTIGGEELSQVFSTNELITMTQEENGIHLVAQDSTGDLNDGFLISQNGFAGLLGSHTQHYSWYHLVMALVYTLIWAVILFGSQVVNKLEARPVKQKA